MSIHIQARPGDFAERVLLPGDPLRAQAIAETYLQNVVCVNRLRGMLGFTGTYRGQRVSVQGTGMGMPSLSIYVSELLQEYGARRLLRVGTCGALQPGIQLGDVILAQAASTDSNMNRLAFGGRDFAPCASHELLCRAAAEFERRGTKVRVGGVMSSDSFYPPDPEGWKPFAAHGVLAIEMETAALYSLAARAGAEALSLLVVTDNLANGKQSSGSERLESHRQVATVALEIA